MLSRTPQSTPSRPPDGGGEVRILPSRGWHSAPNLADPTDREGRSLYVCITSPPPTKHDVTAFRVQALRPRAGACDRPRCGYSPRAHPIK